MAGAARWSTLPLRRSVRGPRSRSREQVPSEGGYFTRCETELLTYKLEAGPQDLEQHLEQSDSRSVVALPATVR